MGKFCARSVCIGYVLRKHRTAGIGEVSGRRFSRRAAFAIGLWCEPEGNLHRLRTFPLFVKGVAYDDLLSVDTDVTGDVTRYQVMKPSGNSTMWLIISEQSLRERVLTELNDLGCGITEGPEAFETLAAVNIQPHVRLSEIDSVLDPLIEKGVVAVAYPALRHSDQ
eukprot:gene6398-6464_t